MAVVNVKAVFPSNVQKVWETVTSFEDCEWRSDLSRAEMLDEKRFIEYTEDGYATTFTIMVMEPCKRLEFKMENDNMRGYWTGIFTSEGGETQVDFTEKVQAKKIYMMPFVKSFLREQQNTYIEDLRAVLSAASRG